MRLSIKKGKHRPGNWWKLIRLWRNKNSITRLVRFDFTAKYDLSSADQDDVNKLFGIGYLWNHHKQSVRFGWNYNLGTNKVNLFAYTYVSGVMSFKKICEINKSVVYAMTISVAPDGYQFLVTDTRNGFDLPGLFVTHKHKKKWSFWLGPYFGGNRTAPHTINIEMK